MLRKLCYKCIPLIPVLRRSDIGAVPERLNDFLGSQLSRHETEFDEGSYSIRKQPIINLIEVREVVDRLTLLVLVVNADLIMEYRMKSHIAESGNLSYAV